MKKRKDGRYRKVVTIEGNTKYCYGRTLKEVAEQEQLFKEKIEKDKITKDLFTTWLEKWWEYHQTTVEYNTVQSYIKPVSDVKEWFTDKPIADIKPSDVRKFIDFLVSKQYARQTINLRHIVMCKTFDYAIENDIDVSNPARAVKLPKGLPVTKREPLTADEEKIVIASNDLFANFLLCTGTRKNEALAVMWEKIDFDKKTITIDSEIIWIGNKPEHVDRTKTESGVRTLPLMGPLEKLLLPVKKKSGYIFNVNGKAYEKKQARTMWDHYVAKIGVDITPHQFRHSFITMMYHAGIDVKSAQAIAGHKKVDIMLNIYTHLDKLSQDKSRVKLNKFRAKQKAGSEQGSNDKQMQV